MHLATCEMLGLQCPNSLPQVGLTTNSAALAAAEELVPSEQLEEYKTQGHVLQLQEDDLLVLGSEGSSTAQNFGGAAAALQRWFEFESSFGVIGFQAVEGEKSVVVRSPAVVDEAAGVLFVRCMTVASAVEWIQFQSLRLIPAV